MKASVEKAGNELEKEGATLPTEHQNEREKEAPTRTNLQRKYILDLLEYIKFLRIYILELEREGIKAHERSPATQKRRVA